MKKTKIKQTKIKGQPTITSIVHDANDEQLFKVLLSYEVYLEMPNVIAKKDMEEMGSQLGELINEYYDKNLLIRKIEASAREERKS